MNQKRRPPGPWGFPLIGHLPRFGLNTTETFRKWRKTYGDVFRIRLGNWNAVVLNGYTTVRDTLERPGDAFSGRPDFVSTQIARELHNNEDSVEFGDFNAAYLKQRKLTASAFRRFTHNGNRKHLEDIIQDEIETLSAYFKSLDGKPADIRDCITLTAGSFIYQVLFGKGQDMKSDETFRQFIKSADSFLEFVGSGNPIDVLPCLKYILKAKVARFLELTRISSDIVQQQINQHKQSLDLENIRDVTDIFLLASLPKQVSDKSVDVTEAGLIPLLNDILGAGYATVSTTMHWLIMYMAAYPDAQGKEKSGD